MQIYRKSKATLSSDERRYHGIPLHTSLGLTRQDIFTMKEMYAEHTAWRKQHPVSPEKQGLLAEELFQKAWSDTREYPRWIVRVRKATKQEDFYEKTDAVVTTSVEEIRVQIKSCAFPHKEMIHHHHKLGIALLAIRTDDHVKTVRARTIKAIKVLIFWQWQNGKRPHRKPFIR